MSRAEDAQMRLYESTRIRDELTDDQAEKLLQWAENAITRLDESGLTDEDFAAKADALMHMLTDVNRFAGRQGQINAQGANEYPASIAEGTAQLGFPLSAEQISAAGTGDPLTTVEALTALMSASPNEPAPPDEPVPSEPPAASESPLSTNTGETPDDETH